MKQVSQPYAPGGTVYWTVYNYDGLGRTTSVVAPDGSVTASYAYAGNTTTVTDAAGKWKTFTTDGMRNLTQVVEPNPAGGTFSTTYTYDVVNHLPQVTMPRGSTTLGDVQTQANISEWNDATSSRDPERGLYTPGTDAYNFWASKPLFSIANYFRNHSDVKAQASLAISGQPNNIYFSPGFVNSLTVENAAALLTHELIHNLGFVDGQIQGALGLDTKAASDNITQKFLTDCFK